MYVYIRIMCYTYVYVYIYIYTHIHTYVCMSYLFHICSVPPGKFQALCFASFRQLDQMAMLRHGNHQATRQIYM